MPHFQPRHPPFGLFAVIRAWHILEHLSRPGCGPCLADVGPEAGLQSGERVQGQGVSPLAGSICMVAIRCVPACNDGQSGSIPQRAPCGGAPAPMGRTMCMLPNVGDPGICAGPHLSPPPDASPDVPQLVVAERLDEVVDRTERQALHDHLPLVVGAHHCAGAGPSRRSLACVADLTSQSASDAGMEYGHGVTEVSQVDAGPKPRS